MRSCKKPASTASSLLIDPHQDVWSRFSGGDGAPGWTLEAAGFDMTRFAETGAAIVHATHGDPFPKMIWPTNGSKLAAATMFTLFFGGNDFAPQMVAAGEPIQEHLQRHFIAAIRQVALRLSDLPNVIGYDTLNEPLPGYIGWRDLNAAGGTVLLGACPTPFQAMLLGAGVPQEVGVWELGLVSIRRTGTRLLNANRGSARGGRAATASGGRTASGTYDAAGRPRLLRPDHFSQVNGRPVDFGEDYCRPFANRFTAAIRAVDPRALIFLEAEAGSLRPPWRAGDARALRGDGRRSGRCGGRRLRAALVRWPCADDQAIQPVGGCRRPHPQARVSARSHPQVVRRAACRPQAGRRGRGHAGPAGRVRRPVRLGG